MLLYLRAFAGLTLENGGRPIVGAANQRGRLAILAVLANAGTRPVSRDQLLALFWPDKDVDSARGALRQALYSLRRDAGQHDLILGTTDIKLNREIIGSDVLDFDAAVTARDFDRAVTHYAGPLLQGIHLRDVPEFERWTERERARRADQYRAVLEHLAGAANARGEYRSAVDLWTSVAATDPFSASASVNVMKAHVRAGNRPAALEHARKYERLVRAEFNAAPDPSVVALAQEIRTGTGPSGDELERGIRLALPTQDLAAGEQPVLPRRQLGVSRVARIAGAFALALVSFAAWQSVGKLREKIPVPPSVVPQRVAVATFQNKSGDPSLDPLGAMAADWIARALAATGVVDVAGTTAELQSRAGVTIAPGPGAIQQLGREARAGIVISGAFYRQGDSLLFQADFTDIAHAKLLQSVGPVASPAGRPLDGIEKLRERATGALALFVDSTLAGIAEVTTRPPSYDAYREFLRGEALYYSDQGAAVEALLRASALDSGYAYALLRTIGVMHNAGRRREADSLIRIADRRRTSLTAYEDAYLEFLTVALRDDYPAMLRATQRMRAAAPKSDFAKYLEADELNQVGRPRAALAVLEGLDPEGGALRGRLPYYYYHYRSLHDLGEHARALELLRKGRSQYGGRLAVIDFHAKALAVMGRGDELVALLDSNANHPPDQHTTPLLVAIGALREAEAHDEGRVVGDLRTWLRSRLQQMGASGGLDPRQHALALAALGDWRRLAAVSDSLTRHVPHDGWMLGLLGLASANLGDRARAIDVERRVAGLQLPHYASPRPPIMARALIAAALGEKERAVIMLRSLPTSGWDQELWHWSPLFLLLRGYAPFDALLVPRG